MTPLEMYRRIGALRGGLDRNRQGLALALQLGQGPTYHEDSNAGERHEKEALQRAGAERLRQMAEERAKEERAATFTRERDQAHFAHANALDRQRAAERNQDRQDAREARAAGVGAAPPSAADQLAQVKLRRLAEEEAFSKARRWTANGLADDPESEATIAGFDPTPGVRSSDWRSGLAAGRAITPEDRARKEARSAAQIQARAKYLAESKAERWLKDNEDSDVVVPGEEAKGPQRVWKLTPEQADAIKAARVAKTLGAHEAAVRDHLAKGGSLDDVEIGGSGGKPGAGGGFGPGGQGDGVEMPHMPGTPDEGEANADSDEAADPTRARYFDPKQERNDASHAWDGVSGGMGTSPASDEAGAFANYDAHMRGLPPLHSLPGLPTEDPMRGGYGAASDRPAPMFGEGGSHNSPEVGPGVDARWNAMVAAEDIRQQDAQRAAWNQSPSGRGDHSSGMQASAGADMSDDNLWRFAHAEGPDRVGDRAVTDMSGFTAPHVPVPDGPVYRSAEDAGRNAGALRFAGKIERDTVTGKVTKQDLRYTPTPGAITGSITGPDGKPGVTTTYHGRAPGGPAFASAAPFMGEGATFKAGTYTDSGDPSTGAGRTFADGADQGQPGGEVARIIDGPAGIGRPNVATDPHDVAAERLRAKTPGERAAALDEMDANADAYRARGVEPAEVRRRLSSEDWG